MSIRHRQTQQPFPANGGWHLRLLLKLSKVITQSKPYNTLIIRITYMVTLDFYILGIIMNGERPHLVVSHSATAACLYLIENKRDTIVQVLVFFGIGDSKKFVCLRPAVQVFLDSLFEMFRTFHRFAF